MSLKAFSFSMIGGAVSEDQLAAMAVRMVMEVDADHNKSISFEEFRKGLEKLDVERKCSIRFLN